MSAAVSIEERVRHFFGEQGPLAERLDGYECRPQQIEMAATIARVLQGESRAVIEAGTGTGKTLAYLIPAVLSDKKVLVSTATKNLQEQIFYKDVPFLKALGFDIDVAYLKGRSNYLCKFRFDDFRRQPLFRKASDRKHFRDILVWAEKTRTGDRAELSDLPDDYATWLDLSTTSDACLGTECPLFDDCFITRVRRHAAKAQIIIVNHHLFFADLAVRSGGHGEVLPEVDAVVFDEAHHLEESATSFFGRQVSIWRVRDLLGDLRRALKDVAAVSADLYALLDDLDVQSTLFFRLLAGATPRSGRVELTAEIATEPSVAAAAERLVKQLTSLGARSEATTGLGETAAAFARRSREVAVDLQFVLSRDDSSWVYLIERRGRRESVFLEARPIDLSDIFLELFYPNHQTTVFTSATLAVNGQFDYFRSRIALTVDEPVAEQRLDGGFDYMKQSILYVPQDLPQPNVPDFAERILPTIERLIRLTEGRAFVLFTSYRNLHAVRDGLRDKLAYPLLVQGERSRSALLDDFRSKPSVLLGTSSFWEGVDVQGELLSLVIIDKLPFASPGDPVLRARMEYLREQGGDPFRQLQLPMAAIALKQGFGRLIRHRTDLGIVAILDRRLLERAYGKVFLATLPRARRTRDLAVVERWWESRDQ